MGVGVRLAGCDPTCSSQLALRVSQSRGGELALSSTVVLPWWEQTAGY